MESAPFHASTHENRSLDEWILGDIHASFLMQMEGDEMRQYGIYHGDMLVIERASSARINEFVIVVKDHAWSIMKWNEIDRSREVKIEAVVRAVIRKY